MDRKELERLYGQLCDDLVLASAMRDDHILISSKDTIKLIDLLKEKINELDNAIDI